VAVGDHHGVTSSEPGIETRVDPETGDWRLIAPRRGARPDDSRPAGAPVCPFCPGNEHLTPPERQRHPAGAPEWRVRVVPNKYAIVSADRAAPTSDGAFPAAGDHEVVIESPEHDWDLRRADPDTARAILGVLRDRCRAMTAGRHPQAIIPFRNYGTAAGASLHHPHSQIVALDHAPPGQAGRWARSRDHFMTTGRRLADDLVAAERNASFRLITDTDRLCVFQPYAAAAPHHTLLVPDDGRAGLADAADEALDALAGILPATLAALAAVRDDPPYNLIVHGGPADDGLAGRWYQWYVSIQPRVTMLGGLELATGLTVDPTSPEQTAPVMREAYESARG
jgi:UDPglucose--hexose-1-phosphate uridylyltransferase